MSKYLELRNNPPKLEVSKNATEVRLHAVSVMCDNKKLLTLKKNNNNEFKLHTGIDAYSNFGINNEKYEIEWAADNNEWSKVFSILNSGYIVIEKVVYR